MSSFPSPTHKYAVGDRVKLFQSIRGIAVDGGVYEVTRQLPAGDNNDFQYRLRSIDGRLERVTFENQLVQVTVPPAEAKPPL